MAVEQAGYRNVLQRGLKPALSERFPRTNAAINNVVDFAGGVRDRYRQASTKTKLGFAAAAMTPLLAIAGCSGAPSSHDVNSPAPRPGHSLGVPSPNGSESIGSSAPSSPNNPSSEPLIPSVSGEQINRNAKNLYLSGAPISITLPASEIVSQGFPAVDSTFDYYFGTPKPTFRQTEFMGIKTKLKIPGVKDIDAYVITQIITSSGDAIDIAYAMITEAHQIGGEIKLYGRMAKPTTTTSGNPDYVFVISEAIPLNQSSQQQSPQVS